MFEEGRQSHEKNVNISKFCSKETLYIRQCKEIKHLINLVAGVNESFNKKKSNGAYE